MAQNVTLYKLLISCPGDVKDEIALVESAVDKFNRLHTEHLGIAVQTQYWSKSSYSQSGGKPQDLLNEQFVNKCDAAVAVFWTRFGTPTDEYESGTEEEIDNMLQAGKQVFMYFSDKELPPSQMNTEDYRKVQEFREKYKDKGIYFTYSTDEEFSDMFFSHLTRYLIMRKGVEETTIERYSRLKLLGIDEKGNLAENVSVYPFVLNTETSVQQYIHTIRSQYQEIADMHVGKRDANYPYRISLGGAVDIGEKERNLISEVAEGLNSNLPDDFFDLGNLSKNPLTINFYNTPDLNGSPEEIQKYENIMELYETISNYLDWASVERAFTGNSCVRLAVQNCGKAIDEDVEIAFLLPQKSYLTIEEFPEFSNDAMSYLLNDCEMSVLFGIPSTAEYLEYSESEKLATSHYTSSPSINSGLMGYEQDYSDDYFTELNDIFCYSVYLSGENYIVKLKVNYIKHNTTVAFPTPLFIKDELTEIPYKITSKNNPDVVEGVLKVQKTNI